MKIALKEKQAGIIIIILHLVGMIGYVLPSVSTYFIWLTPFNLLLTFITLVYFLKLKSLKNIVILASIYLIGFISEYLGVNHQLIFGDYIYGETLGIKAAGVPLIIGINWVVLAIIFAIISQHIFKNKIISILAATLLMVVLDFLIEPVAVHFDYWTWYSTNIPISNYLGWFFVGGVIQILLSFQNLTSVRVISYYIAIGQLIFFTFLNVYLQIG